MLRLSNYYCELIVDSKVALRILLILSIVLQSFIAVSATVDTHQLDVEHMQTTHDHAEDGQNQSDSTEIDNHNIDDCHHCGHCSGSHLSWVVCKTFNSNINLIGKQQFHRLDFFPVGIATSIYRPPIS